MLKLPYKKLLVWQKGISLVKTVYSATQQFPKEESYELRKQLRRAVVSIPSNIAEGSQRGDREFAHFLLIAKGSLAEVETQIIIAHELDYLSDDITSAILQDVEKLNKMLYSFYKKLTTVQ